LANFSRGGTLGELRTVPAIVSAHPSNLEVWPRRSLTTVSARRLQPHQQWGASGEAEIRCHLDGAAFWRRSEYMIIFRSFDQYLYLLLVGWLVGRLTFRNRYQRNIK